MVLHAWIAKNEGTLIHTSASYADPSPLLLCCLLQELYVGRVGKRTVETLEYLHTDYTPPQVTPSTS